MKNKDFVTVSVSIPKVYLDLIEKMFPVSSRSLAFRYIISYYFSKNIPSDLAEKMKVDI